MTEQNNDFVIPQAQPEQEREWMGAGVHLVVIKNVARKLNKDGQPMSSRAGDPAVEVTFENVNKLTHKETYYVGGKAQFRFDQMIQAAGVDNKGGTVSSSVALGKRLWIALRNEYATLSNGEIEFNDKGYRKKFTKAFSYVPLTDPNKVPEFNGNPNDTKESPSTGDFCFLSKPQGTAQQASAPAQAAAPAPQAGNTNGAAEAQSDNPNFPEEWK